MLISKENNIFYLPFLGHKYQFFSFNYRIFLFVFVIQIFLFLTSRILIQVISFLKSKKDNKEKNNYSFIYYSYLVVGKFILNFIKEASLSGKKSVFCFFCSFFSLLIFYNCASLIPHMEEITKDLNAAIAFALFGFFMVQYLSISIIKEKYIFHWISIVLQVDKKEKKLVYYIKLPLFWLLNMLVTLIKLPFLLLEKASFLFALSFRLFGNLFGGSIVVGLLERLQHVSLIYYLATSIFGIQFVVSFYFGLFEGVLQAFVFTLILMNNFASTISSESH
jgi:F0F1-type ATP synthase membrane subunit a